MNRGGLSTFYAQEIGATKAEGGTKVTVYAVREATFSEDMQSLHSRRLRNVTLDVSRRGHENESFELTRDQALELRTVLDRTLTATAGDIELGDSYD